MTTAGILTSILTIPKMALIEITSLDHPGVEIFGKLTESQLRNRLDPGKGIFIAESPKVIRVALSKGYTPVALLCERRHITGDAADIIAECGDIPVYTGERDLLASLTGYTLTRGVLCAMRRPMPTPIADVCRDASRVVVVDGVVDTTNIGSCLGHRRRASHPHFLRPSQPPLHPCVDGLGISCAMDVGG